MAVLEIMPWREVGDMLFVPDSKLDAMDADHTQQMGGGGGGGGGEGAVIRYWRSPCLMEEAYRKA